MGQVVVHKRLKTMKNSKTVSPKSGGSGLQFKRRLFTVGQGQGVSNSTVRPLVLRIGYGRCPHKLVVTHGLTLRSISYSFLKPTVSVNSKSSCDWYLEVCNFLPGVVELYGTMAGLAKGAEQPFMHCSSLLCQEKNSYKIFFVIRFKHRFIWHFTE